MLAFFTFCPIFVACVYLLVLPLHRRDIAAVFFCYLVYLYGFVKKNKNVNKMFLPGLSKTSLALPKGLRVKPLSKIKKPDR